MKFNSANADLWGRMKLTSKEFADGWKVLLAAVVGNALSYGTLAIHSFGILGPAIGRDFHWNATTITSGFLINTTSTLFVAPMAGFLADRYGVRKVALTSIILLSLVYMSFSLLPNSVPIYLFLWVATALLGAGTLPVTWSRALNNRFQANKGLALGISLVGTGLAGSLLKPFEFWLVGLGGWRLGFIGLGCLPLFSFAVAYFLFFDKTPHGVPVLVKNGEIQKPVPVEKGTLLADAIRTRRLWILLAAVGLAAAGVGGAIPNMESILRSRGFPEEIIHSLVPITGMAIVLGRLGSSYLIDLIWAPIIAFVMLLTASVAFIVLSVFLPGPWGAAGIVLTIGLTIGMESDVAAFLVARYFGPRNFGGIYGVIYGAFALGTGLGAVSYGVAFDRFGSYQQALLSSAAILLVSGLMLLSLGSYNFPYLSKIEKKPNATPVRIPGRTQLRG
jgi:predicted MFS family arabinose efflux permease